MRSLGVGYGWAPVKMPRLQRAWGPAALTPIFGRRRWSPETRIVGLGRHGPVRQSGAKGCRFILGNTPGGGSCVFTQGHLGDDEGKDRRRSRWGRQLMPKYDGDARGEIPRDW